MNTGFYKDLDTNFEQALEMSEKSFCHEELINMLLEGNIPQKQIAALKLDKINNPKEAQILISNLTGCDGKIREAVAMKINYLLNSSIELVDYFIYPEIFAQASIDINANICRLVLDSVSILIQNQKFQTDYIARILDYINEAFSELDKFIFRDKKYVINKQLFKLYWCLEALKLFVPHISMETLLPILKKASEIKEYTIREKVAQIIVQYNFSEFIELKNTLINDENYYVRNVF